MNTTLTPQQLRLVALLGILAAAALAWWILVGRGGSESTSPSVTPARTTPAPTRPATAHATKPAVKPATKPHATTRPRPAAKPAVKPAKVATHGMPLKVATALRKHPVVVVSLFIPGAALDKVARAESRAGAKATGAGFVSLNVLRQRQGGPILGKLGAVDTPAVLVVKRPNRVFAQFEGFVDRDTVEQAVANARA
jgi:hypothetical protein